MIDLVCYTPNILLSIVLIGSEAFICLGYQPFVESTFFYMRLVAGS